MKPYSSNVKNKLAWVCMLAMLASFLPAAHAFWGSAIEPDSLPTAATGSAPIATPIAGETYADVMIELEMQATDPDGDAVIFKLSDAPRMGTALIDGSKLQYTPQEGKTGTDKFSYVAVDTLGNVSQAAEVKIKVSKNKAKMTYADMENNPAHYAALQLAQAGILTGEKIGASYFFHPNDPVSRSEFIAMAAAAADLDIVQTSQTDFIDDSGLSDWVKPYISAAASEGLVSGYLTAAGSCEIRGENPITLAEASVIVSNMVSDQVDMPLQTVSAPEATTPAWAQNASAVLTAADILPDELRTANGNDQISRETACSLIYRAMQHLN